MFWRWADLRKEGDDMPAKKPRDGWSSRYGDEVGENDLKTGGGKPVASVARNQAPGWQTDPFLKRQRRAEQSSLCLLLVFPRD